MPVAEKDEVMKVRRSAMNPMRQMVRRGPARRAVATRPNAAAVAHLERLALRTGDHPPSPADVDDRGVGAEQDSGDRAVARKSLDSLRRDWQRELHLRRRRTGKAEKRLERRRDLQVWPRARLAIVERMHREIDERVGQPPREQAMVVLTHALGERLQRRAQSRAADLVEGPAHRDQTVLAVGDGP